MAVLTPMPFQEEGARWLSQRRRALLFDAPGLGKTIQCIAGANYSGIDMLDEVGPASVRTQWVQAMADNSKARIQRAYSFNHARDKDLPERMGVLGLDEIHGFRGRNSGRTLTMFGGEPYGVDGQVIRAERVWGFSGTPMLKDASDLYPIMLGMAPGSLHVKHRGPMDFWSFMKRYCDYYNGDYGIVVKGHKNLDELHDRLAPYVLRRLKKDVIKDWKEPLVGEIQIDVGDALKGLKEVEAGSEGAAIAKALKKDGIDGLRHLTPHSATLRRYTGLLLIKPLGEWLADQFDAGQEKLVIVAFHREVIEGLRDELKKRGHKCVVYWGGMLESKKDEAKMQFIKDPKVRGFIGQIIASGTGLDGLQEVCSREILAEYSYLWEENQQAIDRLDRYGQKEPVLAEFVGIEGSLHGKIATRMRQRAADNQSLFG